MEAKVDKKKQISNASRSTGQRVPFPTCSEVLEATLKSDEKLRTIFSKYFQVPLTSFPSQDTNKPPLERKHIFLSHILSLYSKHLRELNLMAYNYKGINNSAMYLSNEERHQFISQIPKILAEINAALAELKQGLPGNFKKIGNGVYLSESMTEVIFTLFRLLDTCICTNKAIPLYLSIIEETINLYEYYEQTTFCVKFEENTGEMRYLLRKNISFTTSCILYHLYLNVYQTLKDSGDPIPSSEERFLKHAKEFKRTQKEYIKAVPDEKFVPNPDSQSGYFSLFNYYNALVNFYNKEPKKYLHYLTKMMDAREDFNVPTAEGLIFGNINFLLDSEQDLKHHLLLISLGIRVIDSLTNFYHSKDEEGRLRLKSFMDWKYQNLPRIELEEINLLQIRQDYYSRYVHTILELAQQQVTVIERLVKETKLYLFLEKITVQVHSNLESTDIHDVYAELDLAIKDELFVPIIMRELESINVPCRLNENLTISIEASLFEMDIKALKKTFLKAASLCSYSERKHIDQLKKEESEKAHLEEQLKRKAKDSELIPQELPKINELKKEQLKPVYEVEQKKKPRPSAHKGEEKSKQAHHEKKEKRVEVSQKGSFFNPTQTKSAYRPPFKKLPPGIRLHRLRKPDSPCKYWVCIHPSLAHQMNREHKTPELNRLHSQLREGSLGKGQGVRGIIEGGTIKWDDPSRNCRYYGLVAEECHGKSGKHVLLMLTTKVDDHTRKTPNIIVPPELKNTCTQKSGFRIG